MINKIRLPLNTEKWMLLSRRNIHNSSYFLPRWLRSSETKQAIRENMGNGKSWGAHNMLENIRSTKVLSTRTNRSRFRGTSTIDSPTDKIGSGSDLQTKSQVQRKENMVIIGRVASSRSNSDGIRFPPRTSRRGDISDERINAEVCKQSVNQIIAAFCLLHLEDDKCSEEKQTKQNERQRNVSTKRKKLDRLWNHLKAFLSKLQAFSAFQAELSVVEIADN